MDQMRECRTFVCLADDLERLKRGKEYKENEWWNITSKAKKGDQIILYVTQPTSAFVAITVATSDIIPCPKPDSHWRDRPCVMVGDIRMTWPILKADAVEAFPNWGFAKNPRGPSLVPVEIAEKLLEMMEVESQTEKPADFEVPPRIKTTTYRILRDTAAAIRVKKMYGYRCQMCQLSIKLPDGKQYAEAHHIRPLGNEHDGPDLQENILCLCPNHHVKLDYGVQRLVMKNLTVNEEHKIGTEYIDYHNLKIFRPVRKVGKKNQE